MNPENESVSTYEPILQRRLDLMTSVHSWWQKASDEERVAITRLVIEQERLEAKLANARFASVSKPAA
jgi:hypothetical protein